MILGPRQTGKTTLAKKCLSGHSNVTVYPLQNPEIRIEIETDPSRIIRQIKVSITLNLIRDIGSQGCFLDTEMNSAWHSAAGSGLQPEPKIKLEQVINLLQREKWKIV